MKLPTHLAYKRSLMPGKAVFFYEDNAEGLYPLPIERTKIRGSKTGFSEAYQVKKAKGTEEIIRTTLKNDATPQRLSSGNPHTLDTCYLPPEAETLICRFSIRIVANSLKPYDCSDSNSWRVLTRFAERYKQAGGFSLLAERYCKNILCGMWLWRNREAASIDISVATSDGGKYNIRQAHHLFQDQPWETEPGSNLRGLSKEVEQVLSTPCHYWSAEVTAKLNMGFCAEIFPSQCFTDESEVSRVLATINIQGKPTACITADKVNAGIQLIDTWYSEDLNALPLRTNEYGADTHRHFARRHPVTKKDFYTLIQRAAVYERQLRHVSQPDEIPDAAHFMMAVLVKGGMFQGGKAQ